MKTCLTSLWLAAMCLASSIVAAAADSPSAAARAVNALGLDLMAKGTAANENALISPYSIQAALAMTYAGAAGVTHSEMAKVLHYPAGEPALHQSFAALQKALDEVTKTTTERAEKFKKFGGTSEPILLTVANRLFGQQGYDFRQSFLDFVKDSYGAPLQAMDFINKAQVERVKINAWVEQQTHQRIRDLIPEDGVNRETRLVLVNAVYMKAPWAEPFPEAATRALPFAVKGKESIKVPTMRRTEHLGYAKRDGYQVVTQITQIMNRLGNHHAHQKMNRKVLGQSEKSV